MCSTKCKGVVWCKKVIEKMTEEGVKKMVEGLLIAIPAVTVGAGVARVVAARMLQ